jgi:hypothetical protein
MTITSVKVIKMDEKRNPIKYTLPVVLHKQFF